MMLAVSGGSPAATGVLFALPDVQFGMHTAYMGWL